MPREKRDWSESAAVSSTCRRPSCFPPPEALLLPRLLFPPRGSCPPNTKGRPLGRPCNRAKFDDYFLAGGAIASLVALATRNFTTVLALI